MQAPEPRPVTGPKLSSFVMPAEALLPPTACPLLAHFQGWAAYYRSRHFCPSADIADGLIAVLCV